jgi:hypothetical protein
MSGDLSDEALVCRGGSCLAARFAAGAGVIISADGKRSGVSVNCADRVALAALAQSIPNRRIGVAVLGAIRAAGGAVTPAPNSRNPHHCVMNGLTAEQAEALFTPTILNPNAET